MFLTFSQYRLLHFLNIFWILKNQKHFTSTKCVLFSPCNYRAIMGWSWGDNGRSCETCQISKILTPPRESQISNFQRFWKWTTCFSKYRMFCSDNHEKQKRCSLWNRTIWRWTWRYHVIGERYLRKHVDDLFVPLAIWFIKKYNSFLATAVVHVK